MFIVVEKWSNMDSEKQRFLAEFQLQADADIYAIARKSEQTMPWSGFVVIQKVS